MTIVKDNNHLVSTPPSGVNAEPVLEVTHYICKCTVTGRTTNLQGKHLDTGERPNHISGVKYLLPQGGSTYNLRSNICVVS